jgi:hypothetical protein
MWRGEAIVELLSCFVYGLLHNTHYHTLLLSDEKLAITFQVVDQSSELYRRRRRARTCSNKLVGLVFRE